MPSSFEPPHARSMTRYRDVRALALDTTYYVHPQALPPATCMTSTGTVRTAWEKRNPEVRVLLRLPGRLQAELAVRRNGRRPRSQAQAWK